jgi:3-demethoxyubiquinol 3-hydroxylase
MPTPSPRNNIKQISAFQLLYIPEGITMIAYLRSQAPLRDVLISQFDHALRSLTPGTQRASRPNPSADIQTTNDLEESAKRHASGLMRVNHAGEICAQGLYQGQALTARLAHIRTAMERAAEEEIDHLVWCEERLKELNSHTSLLNPVWYGLSFGIGAGAGLISDKISLGFVAATEEQVCKHLQSHLQDLPKEDLKSRRIVGEMVVDEQRHGTNALKAGGYQFPKSIKWMMSLVAKVMTATSYRI